MLAAGCASYQAVPDDYAGPTATLVDSAFQDVGNKGRIFAVTAIDGNPIYDAFDDSSNKSSGRGFMLTLGHAYRKVPIRPMKLTLTGSHYTAAPIQTIFNQLKGAHHSVEGTIDFTPEPDRRYVVRGELGPEGSSVWLVDERTLEVVSEKITSNKN
ncbi:MAG: hypothetical protein M9951_00750 [Burkholderiaceae bacterium]|nr:hypothetical protein [Burkholderiaceae bacterium]